MAATEQAADVQNEEIVDEKKAALEEAKAKAVAAAEEAKAKAVEAKAAAAEAKAKADEEKAAAKAAEEEAKAKAIEEAKAAEAERLREKEEDASPDNRAKIPERVALNMADATVNVLPAATGGLVMCLRDGGLQNLLAGARATVGMKSGRYIFETKIVESFSVAQPQQAPGAPGQRVPPNILRVGVSTAGSSLFLGDSPDNVCFDGEGMIMHDKTSKSKVCSKRITRDMVIGVLVNLEENATNASTISLFLNGERACQPQPLPESLKGKTLYPTITYKNVTLHVNFGPNLLSALPFACRSIGDAAKDDVEVAKLLHRPSDKCEVVFPVGMPDEGVFDWADQFLKEHPQFTELSDRMIIDWAAKSGLSRPGGYAARTSNDKPEMGFRIPSIDDLSTQHILRAAVGAVPRNYLVLELKSNLVPKERKELVSRFAGPEFKKIATVVMGAPPADYQEYIRSVILDEKKRKLDEERRKKKAIADQKKAVALRAKQAEKARKALAAKKAGKEPEEDEEEEAAPMEEEEEAEVPELTEEEKELRFRKMPSPDIAQSTLAGSFATFALPTSEEGFDEIKFAWDPEAKADAHLKEWISTQKKTQRVETLQPSAWFKEQWTGWQKTILDWKRKQEEWKNPIKRKAMLAKKLEEKKKEDPDYKEEEPMEIDFEDLDVFAVEDVTNVGNGEGLYGKFAYEDWTLLSLRFEVHLLLQAFRKDLDDPERPTFHESHFGFYYTKYFHKQFNLKAFGVETLADLLCLIKDTALVEGDNDMLKSELGEDTPSTNFVKLAEEHRRDRQRRVDAGDETAELKFVKTALGGAAAPGFRPPAAGQWAAQAANGMKRPMMPAANQFMANKMARPAYSPQPVVYRR